MFHVPLIDEWSVLSADNRLALLHRIHYGKIEYGVFFSYRVFVNNFKQYSKKSYEQIDGNTLHGRIRKRRIDNQGKQIKAYRKANGLTQTELAERLFVHRKTVSKWENNTCQIPFEKWEKINGIC